MNKKVTDVNKKFGQNLRLIRKAYGMSQDELGRKLGVTFQQIQKYESGVNRISFENAYKISKIFKVNMSDLSGETMKYDSFSQIIRGIFSICDEQEKRKAKVIKETIQKRYDVKL